ncbi:membrane protein [Oceanobacillus picturae]|uniref:Membrane protein n=2 Tax=Oceanobacillus picturae TaxID=171693 RepID=A0A0U9I2H5_9BACI|nr:membrane protein [Oceanobacillus picturae]
MVLLGVLVFVATYYAQTILTKIPNLPGFPALMVICINFMTVMEVLVGQKKEEILFDKARIETLQSSLIVSSLKRFTSSTIYLISLVLIIVCLCGIFGGDCQ